MKNLCRTMIRALGTCTKLHGTSASCLKTIPRLRSCKVRRSRIGYTLMEILLGIALISIFAAGGLWLLFLQQGAYTMTSQRNEAVAKLTSTYQLMFKEIHKTKRSEIELHTTIDHVATAPLSPSTPYLFSYDAPNAKVLWLGNPILIDTMATFSWDGTYKVVKVELQSRTTGDRLNFLVAPRNP